MYAGGQGQSRKCVKFCLAESVRKHLCRLTNGNFVSDSPIDIMSNSTTIKQSRWKVDRYQAPGL